jgi:hypothetical protein
MNIDNNEIQEDSNISYKLKVLAIMTLVLAASRMIISFEILLCFGDLTTALIIYFYFKSKTKCMAICCMIYGSIGIVYALIKFFNMWSLAKTLYMDFYQVVLILINLYSIIVYSFLCYMSYNGIKTYEIGFSIPPAASQLDNGNAISTNYGAISAGFTANNEKYT